ncbi:restriction endonuclease subunit S [Arthrobacter sp. UYEF3]|uniref:restriction endonuclease subunit S n=1 Tax=Arthrobacter sp. UYEF3 TaxID=1756365 RepID=UPI003393FD87
MTTPLGWQMKPLSEVVSLQRGFDLPHHARQHGAFPVLTSGETGGFHDEGPIKGPGVTIGRATNLGQPKWSDGDFWPHNTTMFVTDFMGNLPRWVFHFFENTDLAGYDSGSVQPMLNRNYIAQVPVLVPPLDEQQAIAEVLAALDDKIAANITLAETADKLASAEFHQRARNLPFAEQSFGDVAKVSGGGTPSTSVLEFWNGNVLWATPTDVTGLQGPYLSATSRRISEAGLQACASELYPSGAILMTSRATIGAFALAREPMAVNQGFIVVQPQDPDLRFWLFHEMRSRVGEFISLANGATFLELSRGNFKKFKVRLAEAQVMKEFAGLAEPLHAAAAHALLENSMLAATRDTLLPQLMSGKLRVKEANKFLEEAGV